MLQRNATFATILVAGMIMVEPGCTARNLRRNDWSSSSSRDIIIAPRLEKLTVSITVSPTLELPGDKK